MKEINVREMEFVIGEMKRLQAEHPKAVVLYDFEKCRVNITYPFSQTDFGKYRPK